MPTKRDVIERAFRFLGVVADDEPMTAAQEANGTALLESLYSEMVNEAPPYWTIDDIPAGAATFVAMALAADLAPTYGEAPPMSRGSALLRVYGAVRPDDRAEVPGVEYF